MQARTAPPFVATPPAPQEGPEPSGFIADAIESCHQRGLNLTPIRRRVLEVVAASDGPVSAYAIIHRLSDIKLLAPPTVYRALEFLVEAGFVRHLALRKAFVCRARLEPEPLAILVCTGCGSVAEGASELIRRTVAQLAEAIGFEASGQAIEIQGRCAACRVDAGSCG